jgi:hypothetical protein
MHPVLNFAASFPNSSQRSLSHRCVQHPDPLCFLPLQRSLNFVSLQLLCHVAHRLRLLCCCRPLSVAALRLAHDVNPYGCRSIAACIMKRFISVFSRQLWAAWLAALLKGDGEADERRLTEAEQRRRPPCVLC